MTNPSNVTPQPTIPTAGKPTLSLEGLSYTNFFKTMLILSTVGTAISGLGLLGLLSLPADFATSPLLGISSSLNYVISALSVWALVLLWLKKPLGIHIKLACYAASLVVTVGFVLSSGALIRTTVEATNRAGHGIDASSFEAFVRLGLYASYCLMVIRTIVFGLLWWQAWKKQLAADSNI